MSLNELAEQELKYLNMSAKLTRVELANEELLMALSDASNTICSEFCGRNDHHDCCKRVTEVLSKHTKKESL